MLEELPECKIHEAVFIRIKYEPVVTSTQIAPDEPELIARMVELYNQDMTVQEVADATGQKFSGTRRRLRAAGVTRTKSEASRLAVARRHG